MLTYTIHTFGCQMNVGDAQWLTRALRARGFKEGLNSLDKATAEHTDITIVYTCSVREKPEEKVYQVLARLQHMHRNNPNYVIAVGGCVAQQIGEKLFTKFPAVRVVFGTDGTSSVPNAIERVLEDNTVRISLLDFIDEYPEREIRLSTEVAPVEYVNIMQGCDNYCAFCIVPFTRGKQKSRKHTDILEECTMRIQNGAKEIMLLGQNVNAYGFDCKEISFASLLKKITRIDGVERISFMTPHPKDFDDETVELFATSSVLSPRVHLPLQAGSDAILSAMGRQYTRKDYILLVEKLRNARPDIAFSTDIIVGFPGETEKDFIETLSVMKEVGFAMGFSFCYSDRPGTKASMYTNKIVKEVALERLSRLQELQTELSEAYLASYIGKELDILCENPRKKQNSIDGILWHGRDVYGNAVRVVLPEAENAIGRTIRVRVVDASRHSLLGEHIL